MGYFKSLTLLGLSTSCSRFSKKFPKRCSKTHQKLLFVTKVAHRLLVLNKTFFCSDAKICKLYNKSKHFCAILRHKNATNAAKQLCPQLKPKKSNELIKLLNDLLHRQVQKLDRINSDRLSGSDQLGSTRIE